MKILTLLFILSFSTAQAIEITVNQNSCGGAVAALCAQINAEATKLVNEDLPEVDIQKYADGTANAISIANAGRGSDYGKNFDIFTLKLGFGVGVDASTGGLDKPEDIDGVAFGGGITAGVNLGLLPIKKIGFLDFSKMDLMFNFSGITLDQDFNDAKAKGDLGGFGFMVRYRLFDSVDMPSKYLAQWGGVQIHTGFQRSSMDINYTQSFNDEKINLDQGGGNSIVGNFSNASGTFDMEAESTVIPIEVSTYMRLLYVFTLYGGAGMDIVSGSSDIKFNGSGNISAGLNTDNGDYTASLSASESAKGSPEATNFRAFVGLQFNVPVVSVYVHVNKNMSSDILGANLGVNIAW